MGKEDIINKKPVARIFYETVGSNVYQGDTITFDGTRSYDDDGDIIYYDWDLNGETKRTGETIDITFSTAGKYVITLTVEDNNRTKTSETITINVLNAIEITINSYQHKTKGIWTNTDYLYVQITIKNNGGNSFDLSDSSKGYFKIKSTDNKYYDGYISSGDYRLESYSTNTNGLDFNDFPKTSNPKTLFFNYEDTYKFTVEFT